MSITSDRIPAAHARSAWAAGIEPLREAFPQHADRLLRAIAYSHRASLPVPIFISGAARSGKSTLAQAIAELAGEQERAEIPTPTLGSIRRAAHSGVPLIVDEAAPAKSRARPNMFDQLETEIYATYSTKLHHPSVLVATGGQPIDPLSASRIIAIDLPLRPRSVQTLKAVSSEPAAAGRRIVASYLQQRATTVDVDAQALTIANYRELDNIRRLGAALHIGDEILRALSLDDPPQSSTSWLAPNDQVVWAMREALRYLLDNGGALSAGPTESADWPIGRVDANYVYIRPAEALPFIRAAHGNPTLSTRAITDALRDTRLLTTNTGTTPTRVGGQIVRAWRVSNSILD